MKGAQNVTRFSAFLLGADVFGHQRSGFPAGQHALARRTFAPASADGPEPDVLRLRDVDGGCVFFIQDDRRDFGRGIDCHDCGRSLSSNTMSTRSPPSSPETGLTCANSAARLQAPCGSIRLSFGAHGNLAREPGSRAAPDFVQLLRQFPALQ